MQLITATGDDYSEVMHTLRPRGPAMATLDNVLDGMAQEPARAHNYLNDLLSEADPRTTNLYLSRWEAAAGLPDACCGPVQTLDQRINALVNKILGAGTPTKQYFIDLAARAGYVITITTFSPHTVRSPVGYPIYPANIVFVWQVNAALDTVVKATVRSNVKAPLATWGNAILECIIRRANQAHMYVQFSYS